MKVSSKGYVAILFSLVVVFSGFVFFDQKGTSVKKEVFGYHDSTDFFEEKLFFDQIFNLEDGQKIIRGVSGAVIPHHLLASDIIVSFFSRLANKDSIKRIVLIGPNHYERGNTVFTTSTYGWETPVGNVFPDSGAVDHLVKENSSLQINEEVISQEHSIGGIMPFIAHYVPNADVVPIAISRQATLPNLEELAKSLKSFNKKDTIFIASVDFSHYLSLSEAQEKDVETLEILRQKDLEALLALDESNVDSPESLALLILLMGQQGISMFDVLEHKNSADYTDEAEAETTSYYSIVFTK